MNVKHKSKKVDFTKYDYKSIEYSIDKKLGCMFLHKEKPFIERMNYDVQRRQTKNSKRIQLLHTQRPTLPECERTQSFNRLIEDANRRREKQETLKEQNNVQQQQQQQVNQTSKKFTPQQWNQVYNERFIQFKVKQEEKLDKMIIQKEKIEKKEEEVIVETINSHTKRKNAKEINEIVNRIWDKVNKKQEQKKEGSKRNESAKKEKKKCKGGVKGNNKNGNNGIMKMRKDLENDFGDNIEDKSKEGEEMNNYMMYKTNYFGLQ